MDYSGCSLILVGHGSTLNADSATPVYQHANALRQQKIFAQVLEAFWKQEPYLWAVLRGAYTPLVFVVPLFISEGYFTQEVIPREMGFSPSPAGGFERRQNRNGQEIVYAGPVGTHPSMTGIILARAVEVVQHHPFPLSPPPGETSLFIAGHGTSNNENSRQAIEQQVDIIRAQGAYAEVQAIFMEEEPRISSCYTLAKSKYLVVVPFFVSDGLHSYEDIPVMLGAPPEKVQRRLQQGQPGWANPTERKGKLVWYASSVGREPLLSKVIMDRVKEAGEFSRTTQSNVLG